MAKSRGEARRLVDEKAVEQDGNIIYDIKAVLKPGILKIGKRRFLKIII